MLLWNGKDDSNGDGDGGKVNNGDKFILKLHYCASIICNRYEKKKYWIGSIWFLISKNVVFYGFGVVRIY